MKTKRILSATLAAAMLLCCCILTAFAESETYIGYYNGYSYTCTAVCRTDTCKANMATESSEAYWYQVIVTSFIETERNYCRNPVD